MIAGRPPARQRGAALLIALVAVALASVIALGLIERGQRDLARTRALVESERGWQLAAGLDALAREWIRQQREAGIGSGALDGRWSPLFTVPGGAIRGRVFELDGRFNLNALAAAEPETALRAQQEFQRLARLLELDPALTAAITALYAPGADGRRLPLAHLSELDRLDRMGLEQRRRLQPWLTVLPDPDARLNVNLATPETLMAVVPGLSREQAAACLAARPYDRLSAVFDRPELAGRARAKLEQRLGVDTRWFLAEAEVVLDGEARRYYRLLGPGGDGFRYVSRGIR